MPAQPGKAITEEEEPTSRGGWSRRLLLIFGFGSALAGCQDAPRDLVAPPDAGPSYTIVSTVRVQEVGGGMAGAKKDVNDQFSMYVTATDQNGMSVLVAGHVITWISSDPQVASVLGAQYATVQALKGGTTYISAVVDGVSSNAFRLVVREPTSIEVSPASIQMGLGESLDVYAKLYDQTGEEMAFPNEPLWSVDNAGIAQVSSTQLVGGRARATVSSVSMGSTTVRVQLGQVTAAAAIHVRPSAIIEGPYHIAQAGWYTFVADPFGGNGTYTYQWYMDTSYGRLTLGTGPTQSIYVDESNNADGIQIGVVVSSAGGTGGGFKWTSVAVGCGAVDWCG